MIFLFSGEKNREEQEITEILRAHGAGILSDAEASLRNAPFLVLIVRAPLQIETSDATAIFTAACEPFGCQRLPPAFTGVCEEGNRAALGILQKNGVRALSCGMDQRNTLTLSSISDRSVLAGLQRTLTDRSGAELSPAEYPIRLTKPYGSFPVMAATAALLLEGVVPTRF